MRKGPIKVGLLSSADLECSHTQRNNFAQRSAQFTPLDQENVARSLTWQATPRCLGKFVSAGSF